MSLGSNLGDRHAHLIGARKKLDEILGRAVLISHVYETPPWGNTDQPQFYNQVLAYLPEDSVHAADLLKIILETENQLGRKRFEKWGPRLIDIDILFFGQEIHTNKYLQIPHPEIRNRRFVLEPLHEILPEFIDPMTGKSIRQLLDHCPDKSVVHQTSLQ